MENVTDSAATEIVNVNKCTYMLESLGWTSKQNPAENLDIKASLFFPPPCFDFSVTFIRFNFIKSV